MKINLNILKYIFYIFLLLMPFYFFANGLPQISDLVGLLLICLFYLNFIFNSFILNDDSLLLIKKFVFLFLYIFCINFIFTFYYIHIDFESDLMISVLYYFFNFSLFLFSLYYLPFFKSQDFIIIRKIVFQIIIIQFILIFFFYFYSIKQTTRGTLFFNNPNQLGYFILIMFTFYTILCKITLDFKYFIHVLIFSIILILYSGSRAAIFGISFHSFIFLINERKNYIFIIPIILFLLFHEYFIALYKLLYLRDKFLTQSNISEFKLRGYDRLLFYPEYLFFGAGEGSYKRFLKSYHQLEIHSGFISFLFCYGVIGCIFLLNFLKSFFLKFKFRDFVILIPLIFYNLSHNGFRESLLWILLPFFYFYIKKRETNSLEYEI